MTLWRILNSKILIKVKVVLVRALKALMGEWTVYSSSHNLGTECLTSPGGLLPRKERGAQWLWGPTVGLDGLVFEPRIVHFVSLVGVLLCYVALCELTRLVFTSMMLDALTGAIFGLYYNVSNELWSVVHLQGPHSGMFHFNSCEIVNVFTVRVTLGFTLS
jgi:hypothetical protein